MRAHIRSSVIAGIAIAAVAAPGNYAAGAPPESPSPPTPVREVRLTASPALGAIPLAFIRNQFEYCGVICPHACPGRDNGADPPDATSIAAAAVNGEPKKSEERTPRRDDDTDKPPESPTDTKSSRARRTQNRSISQRMSRRAIVQTTLRMTTATRETLERRDGARGSRSELVWVKRQSAVDPHRDARFDQHHGGADGEHVTRGARQPVTGIAEHHHQCQTPERHQQHLHAHRVRMLIDVRDDVVAGLVDAGQRRDHKQRGGEQDRERDPSDHRNTTIHSKSS